MSGKESALFVPSGTMGNLISCMVHCNERGSEMILGMDSHIFYFEQGGASHIGGIHPRSLPNKDDGTIDIELIAQSIRSDDVHFPRTKLICLETTHNRCGGAIISASYINQVASLAKANGLKLHIDGARIFHSVVELGISLKEYIANVDSVSICLSKGLASPIGSVICGSSEFIKKARRLRKALGGGMRQIGVICAAGIVSLKKMVNQLPEDHARAKSLAAKLSSIPGLKVVNKVQTNILFVEFDHPIAKEVSAYLKEKSILVNASTVTRMRFVTHYMITDEHVDCVVELLKNYLQSNTGTK